MTVASADVVEGEESIVVSEWSTGRVETAARRGLPI